MSVQKNQGSQGIDPLLLLAITANLQSSGAGSQAPESSGSDINKDLAEIALGANLGGALGKALIADAVKDLANNGQSNAPASSAPADTSAPSDANAAGPASTIDRVPGAGQGPDSGGNGISGNALQNLLAEVLGPLTPANGQGVPSAAELRATAQVFNALANLEDVQHGGTGVNGGQQPFGGNLLVQNSGFDPRLSAAVQSNQQLLSLGNSALGAVGGHGGQLGAYGSEADALEADFARGGRTPYKQIVDQYNASTSFYNGIKING